MTCRQDPRRSTRQSPHRELKGLRQRVASVQRGGQPEESGSCREQRDAQSLRRSWTSLRKPPGESSRCADPSPKAGGKLGIEITAESIQRRIRCLERFWTHSRIFG